VSGRGRSGAILVGLLAFGCLGPGDVLARGQAYYEDNEYERALAVWRELDRHDSVLTPAERARYAYLRGMTDYRLGFRDDARHWLAVAKVTERRYPRSLDAAWLERLDGALGDLDRETFGIRTDGTDPVQSIEVVPALVAPAARPPTASPPTNEPPLSPPPLSPRPD
jgi:hypothetical protein